MSQVTIFTQQNLRLGLCSIPKNQNQANELAQYLLKQNVKHIIRIGASIYDDSLLLQKNIKIHQLSILEKQTADEETLNIFFQIIDDNFNSYYQGQNLTPEQLKQVPMVIIQSEEAKGRGPYLVMLAFIQKGMQNTAALTYVRETMKESVCNVSQVNQIIKFKPKVSQQEKKNYNRYYYAMAIVALTLVIYKVSRAYKK